MAELKTKPTQLKVENYINSITDEDRKKDALTIIKLLKKITKEDGVMWGNSIIGFGSYHYSYASGREGDWLLTGFSSRKQAMTIYLMCDLPSIKDQLDKLGKYKIGKSCLYIKKLSDIDLKQLEKVVKFSIQQTKKKYK